MRKTFFLCLTCSPVGNFQKYLVSQAFFFSEKKFFDTNFDKKHFWHKIFWGKNHQVEKNLFTKLSTWNFSHSPRKMWVTRLFKNNEPKWFLLLTVFYIVSFFFFPPPNLILLTFFCYTMNLRVQLGNEDRFINWVDIKVSSVLKICGRDFNVMSCDTQTQVISSMIINFFFLWSIYIMSFELFFS